MSVDRADQGGQRADLLARARAAGAREAEVFGKTARGRRLVLEPAVLMDGRPRITMATSVETGVALRVMGRSGGWGMAWRSPFEPGSQADLVGEALLAATLSRPEGDGGAPGIPCAPPRGALPAAADLGLFDARVLDRPIGSLRPLLEEAAETTMEACGGRALIDAVTLSEAVLSIDLINSFGFTGCYTRTLVLLSVLTAPVAPGARAVMEERSSSRLDGLDARGCGLDAARRSLAGRGAVPAGCASPPVVMLPRAAADLLVRLVSSLLAGDGAATPDRRGRAASSRSEPRVAAGPRAVAGARAAGEPGGGALGIVDDGRLAGAFGSAPFDGVGHPTATTLLVDGGRLVGRLSPEGGNVIRPSLREPPVLGLSNLRLVRPGRTPDIGPGPGTVPGRCAGSPDTAALLDPGADPCLLIEALRCRTGPPFAIEVLRGEWRSRGVPIGPADGLIWEGPPGAILSALAGIGDDDAVFHPGLPVVVPTLRMEGLGAWRHGERGEGPAAGPEDRPSIRPPALRE